jgi:hypothetical protein
MFPTRFHYEIKRENGDFPTRKQVLHLLAQSGRLKIAILPIWPNGQFGQMDQSVGLLTY